MKLPKHQKAIISKEKLTDYLLCLTHSSGWSKARFFLGQGYSLQNWQELEVTLKEIAKMEVVKIEETAFGTRYVIDGKICTPNQRTPYIRTVWFIENDETTPYFVTAYPKENKDD